MKNDIKILAEIYSNMVYESIITMSPNEVQSLNLYHGGLSENATLDEIDLNRPGTQQDKKGRGYGGFYLATDNKRSKAWVDDYSNKRGNRQHRITLKPNAKVAYAKQIPELKGMENIDRLDNTIRNKLSEQYDAIIGYDVLGREQVVLLNKNAVASFKKGIYNGENYIYER